MDSDEKIRPWRQAVGGMWDEIGKLQFGFLVNRGLKPEHYLLDVGCGSLRGGIHFIKYLQRGHYFGIDKSSEILNGGRFEMAEHFLESKNPTLCQMDDFNFSLLTQQFDYALAQSIFTHLSLAEIRKCLENIEGVLIKGGRFFATFFENTAGDLTPPLEHPTRDGIKITTHSDSDPYHYSFKSFEELCYNNKLEARYIGDWNHPRNQKMVVFIRK